METEEQLFKEMAELTLPKCKECPRPMSCCDPMYCEIAEGYSKERGFPVPEKHAGRLPFMGPNGCVMPPHQRPLCTLHVCSINGLGFDPKDPEWTKNYFKLREKIENYDPEQQMA